MKPLRLLTPLLALGMLIPSLALAKAVVSESPAEPKKEAPATPEKLREEKRAEETKKATESTKKETGQQEEKKEDPTAQIIAGLKLLQIVGGTAGKVALTVAGFSKLAKGLDITLSASTTITRELNKPEDKRNIALLTQKQKALQGVPALIQPDLEKAGKILASILEPLFKKSIINDLRTKGDVYVKDGVEMVEITKYIRNETTKEVEETSVEIKLNEAPREKLKNLAYQVVSVGQGLQKMIAEIIDSYIEAQKPTETKEMPADDQQTPQGKEATTPQA